MRSGSPPDSGAFAPARTIPLQASTAGVVRRALGMLVLLGHALAPALAHAYCRTDTCDADDNCEIVDGCPAGGKALAWRRACVSFSVQEDGAPPLEINRIAAEDLIGRAFATWVGAACAEGGRPSIDVINLGAVSCNKVEYNKCEPNANVWIFRNTTWPYEESGHDLGLTEVQYNPQTGEIRGADVEINVPRVLESQVDLLEILTHEAGHFLGLEHSPVGEATMFSAPTSYNMSDLASDDIDGICAAYPSDEDAGACDPTPPHGFSGECGSGDACQVEKGGCAASPVAPGEAGTPFWVLALAGAALAMQRRRVRRAAPPA